MRKITLFAWNLISLKSVPGKLRSACFLSVGMCVGLAVYVVHIPEAASYLSDNPETCINCHIMVP